MQSAALNFVVVHAAPKSAAPVLDDPHTPAFAAVVFDGLLQVNYTVGNAAHLQVSTSGRSVIEQQHCAGAAGKKLFERQHLSAITQGRIGEQLQLGQGVNHHANRFALLNDGENHPQRGAHFNFRRVKHRVLRFRLQLSLRLQHFMNVNPGHRPAMRVSHTAQFIARFRQRDVHHRLAFFSALLQELQTGGGLAAAGLAFHHVDTIGRQATAQNVVKPRNTGGQKLGR